MSRRSSRQSFLGPRAEQIIRPATVGVIGLGGGGSHVVQQLGAALRDTRETRRARDLNFRARGIMLLGTAYPLLAVREGNDWQREVKASVGDLIFAEVADYDVTIAAPADVALFWYRAV